MIRCNNTFCFRNIKNKYCALDSIELIQIEDSEFFPSTKLECKNFERC